MFVGCAGIGKHLHVGQPTPQIRYLESKQKNQQHSTLHERSSFTPRFAVGETGVTGRFIKRLFGDRVWEYMGSYDDYILWDVIFEEYLPKKKCLRVLEVGCAPGRHLIEFNRRYDYIPYGIDYSEAGIDISRRVFASVGLNQKNIFLEDFFSEEFQSKYNRFFDLVFSFGFIEHFSEVDRVVEKHVDLLRDGGILVVGVPNLRGINYWIARFFNNESLLMHNRDIMIKENFFDLFKEKNLKTIYCNYYGTFNFCVFNANHSHIKKIVLRCCFKMQRVINLLFRICLRGKQIYKPLTPLHWNEIVSTNPS